MGSLLSQTERANEAAVKALRRLQERSAGGLVRRDATDAGSDRTGQPTPGLTGHILDLDKRSRGKRIHKRKISVNFRHLKSLQAGPLGWPKSPEAGPTSCAVECDSIVSFIENQDAQASFLSLLSVQAPRTEQAHSTSTPNTLLGDQANPVLWCSSFLLQNATPPELSIVSKRSSALQCKCIGELIPPDTGRLPVTHHHCHTHAPYRTLRGVAAGPPA